MKSRAGWRGAWGAVVWVLAMAASARGQEGVAVSGTILDAQSGAPVDGAVVTLTGIGTQSVTDSLGAFHFRGVPPGSHTLHVRHIAYGSHEHQVEVPAHDLELELKISSEALELEPIQVEVQGRVRTESTRSNVITRLQIESVLPRARNIGDVVRSFIPSARVSETRGGFLCIEFRGASGARTSGCNFPLVVMDGLPVIDPYHFLRDLRVQDLERIEFVPASEATARYGRDASFGALVIETRRSGVAERRPEATLGFPAYDWSREPAGHPTRSSLLAGGAASFVGTALALAAVGCLPGSADAGPACVADAGTGAGIGALLIPWLGTTLASRWKGETEVSRGSLLPGLGFAAVPAALGYTLYVQGGRSGFAGERLIGAALFTVGVPLAATLADYLFRGPR